MLHFMRERKHETDGLFQCRVLREFGQLQARHRVIIVRVGFVHDRHHAPARSVGLPEKVNDASILVFFRGQHGNDDITGRAYGIRHRPMAPFDGIHVRGVQQYQGIGKG
ncbi:MAG: hypothetical protein BWX80_04052 [Candidatus Hydrogenedentes bacterium ADurb.Bin101]|nr:MAG: hypothetical protein BWX80_04052 [Candidatus Hydrogenedentes bacterium ADurb.Bin101]